MISTKYPVFGFPLMLTSQKYIHVNRLGVQRVNQICFDVVREMLRMLWSGHSPPSPPFILVQAGTLGVVRAKWCALTSDFTLRRRNGPRTVWREEALCWSAEGEQWDTTTHQLATIFNPYNAFITDAVTIHICEIEFFMEFRVCILGSSIICLCSMEAIQIKGTDSSANPVLYTVVL